MTSGFQLTAEEIQMIQHQRGVTNEFQRKIFEKLWTYAKNNTSSYEQFLEMSVEDFVMKLDHNSSQILVSHLGAKDQRRIYYDY